ncbi:hypothetical protein KZP23_15805 [Echinicola marina]|uniref:hypothetical protein n=1 Tax=Echinicola marina TaxID=2859768 RepID=UPI001CF6BDE2|nr:hypothetical protein [Echinicola marina]UCS92165.1 hypothetical protein KZP23_15805 [Echinicola marina]
MRYILLLLAIIMLSCQSSKELHYFKQGENYYRLKIKQLAFLSSSRYMSGAFDENAVDYYFGEIARPDSAKVVDKPLTKLDPGQNEESLSNKKMLFLLSTNSDIVAEQIGGYAENERVLEMVAKLANKEIVREQAKLSAQEESLLDQKVHMQNLGDEIILNLDTANLENSKAYIELFLGYSRNIRLR